jgi:hypothetical protein
LSWSGVLAGGSFSSQWRSSFRKSSRDSELLSSARSIVAPHLCIAHFIGEDVAAYIAFPGSTGHYAARVVLNEVLRLLCRDATARTLSARRSRRVQ